MKKLFVLVISALCLISCGGEKGGLIIDGSGSIDKGWLSINSNGGSGNTSLNPFGPASSKGNTSSNTGNTSTYTPPTSNYTDAEKTAFGINPVLVNSSFLTYGIYPDEVVDDTTTLNSLNSLDSSFIGPNGWYRRGSKFYAKIVADPYIYATSTTSEQYFHNEYRIIEGRTYWFECSLISWCILSEEDGAYTLISHRILDCPMPFYKDTNTRSINGSTVYPNNYEHSDIRAWLNSTFYTTAFALSNSHIQTSFVDNSASSTFSSSNTYACSDTNDKVYLPSYQECQKSGSLLYKSENVRIGETNDFARARGAYTTYVEARMDNGKYWTRSPGASNGNSAYSIDYKSRIDTSTVSSNNGIGVRPVIKIRF